MRSGHFIHHARNEKAMRQSQPFHSHTKKEKSMRKLKALAIFATVLAGSVAWMAGSVGSAEAGQAEQKVNVCHIPPGNPANFHTILISPNALAAHLAHGDSAGSCDNLCALLCDDGNACTIDDTGDCEQHGCPAAPRQAVNCDDQRECTIDACDPASGCTNRSNAGAACDDGLACTGPDACTS